MALAVVQSAPAVTGNSVASITATFSGSTTSGNLLVAQCASFSALAVAPLSDSKGNTWSLLTTQTSGSVNSKLGYVANCTGGASHTVTLSMLTSGYPSLTVSEVSGAATSSVTDGETGATQATGTSHTSGDITTTNADDILFAVSTASGSSTYTEDAAFTNTANLNTTASRQGIISGYRIVSATGTYNRTFTTSANEIVVNRIAAFKAAAGGTSAALNAAGTGTMTGAGAASATSALNAVATSAGQFTARASASSNLNAAGQATASFVGDAAGMVSADFSAAGSSIAQFGGAAIVAGAMDAHGEADAIFVARDANAQATIYGGQQRRARAERRRERDEKDIRDIQRLVEAMPFLHDGEHTITRTLH